MFQNYEAKIMLEKKFVQNSCEIGQFFCESNSENPTKLALFSATYQKPWKQSLLN